MPDTSSSSRPFDVDLGKSALAELEPTLKAIDGDDIAIPNSEPEVASVAALVTVDAARVPRRAARLALLPAELFDPGTVARVEKAAWALWYASVEVRSATSAQSGVKVSPEVLAAAYEVKGRLQHLLEYHLGDDTVVARELADIKLGTGYGDTASDLVRYAKLHEGHRGKIDGDRKLYREGDAELARSLAAQILAELKGSLSSKEQVTDLRNRAWTLLNRDHTELVTAAHFVFRGSADDLAAFVPLRAAVARAKPRKGKGGGEPGGGEPGGPVGPTG